MAKILKETGLEELIRLIKAALESSASDLNDVIENHITIIEGNIQEIQDSLEDYALKEDTYTKDEVDELVDKLPKMKIEVVEELPEDDIDDETIYLVPKDKTGENNIYEEYFHTEDGWELIGDTEVDLSNYYTKDETYSKEEIDDMLEEITAAEVLAMWNAADEVSS